jgi:GT2 family glycosyltransferase
VTTFDLVSIYHREENYQQFLELADAIALHEDPSTYNLIGVDNRVTNRGFARGCNHGSVQGTAPYLGFLNPDVLVDGPFLNPVLTTFQRKSEVQVTGSRFDKDQREVRAWGCRDWVCGAAFFVRRSWWEKLGGFDEAYVWGWEETDFIRRTEADGALVRSIPLPLRHDSPSDNSPDDTRYKRRHFEAGAAIFRNRWARR